MLPLIALWLASTTAPALAQTAGSFADAGNSQISAMMMFVGNDEKVYILDKAEGNAAKINNHPAWGAVWDIKTHAVELMDVKTNVFCASGMHLPNGSYATFGGNGAVGPGGNRGSVLAPGGFAAVFDDTYQDLEGQKAIRVLNPCKNGDDFKASDCTWYDDPAVLGMQKQRWYSAAEPLGDGTVALIGGFSNGGYVNRNFPNVHPEADGAEPTYEFYPSNGREAQVMQFMIKTSGLNAYAHTYLLPSGKMFVQANISSMIWDPATNAEIPLPDMPGKVARVYPASGAVAMLPLTPKNKYTPTVLFCGGTDMEGDAWGNYSFPFINTWEYPASPDCQRITPEPADGSTPAYEQDDDMLEGRTMGQFVIMPDGKYLVINGGINGTAGYAEFNLLTPKEQMPFGMSLASGPVGKPAIYDPAAPLGKRWSNAGLSTSPIPRLYHSSAVLLPDASVLVAGSNPNVDVTLDVPFPTEYRMEIFYPPYFAAKVRPAPVGLPSTLSYGGAPFDIKIPAGQYSGSSNTAAENAIISLVRTGWTTHAMNMGQRFLQLEHSFTVASDGGITFHVSQMPPVPNVFQPGPAFMHVVINGIPSVGSYVIVGSGKIETQPITAAVALPASVRVDSAKGTAEGSQTSAGGGGTGSDDTDNAASSINPRLLGPGLVVAVVMMMLGMSVW